MDTVDKIPADLIVVVVLADLAQIVEQMKATPLT
jgi:hypothetical protein